MASTRSLGVLTMDVLVRNAAFETGMDKTARIADKRFNEIERRAKKFGTALGIGIAGGITAVTAGMTLYIKNTIEAEKVQAQLASRIKDTGGAAQRSLSQLGEMADKLQSMTIFDDEAIGGVQAMLLTFKGIQGVNFDAATAAVLDLSTAMEIDLSAASIQLGKALNDPIKGVTALAKAGVQFSEDQKKVIKALVDTGDIAGAQRVILKELEGQMGTAAEASRNTLGGALQGLKNNFDNLLEGDTGGDGLRGTTTAINDLSDSLTDPSLKSGIDSTANGLLKIAKAAVEAVAWVGNAVGAVSDYYGDISKRSAAVLRNQVREQEDVVARTQRMLRVTQNVPFLGAMDVSVLRNEKAKLADLEAAYDAAEKRAQQAATEITGATAEKPRPDKPHPTTVDPKNTKALDDARRRADELAESMRAAAESQAEWHSRILDMTADLAGPTAQVLRDYDKSMQELTAEFNSGEVALADYATAQDLLAQRRDKDLAAIKAQVTPLQEVNAAIAEQLQLIGMSAEAQEIWNNLKFLGADADEAQRQQIIESTKALQEQREAMSDQIEAMDAIRDGSKNFLKDLLGGTKSWKDSFLDALDDIQARFLDMIAQNFADQLFGKQGDPAGGSTGGWFGALMSAFGGSSGGGGGGESAGSLMDLFGGAWGYAGGGYTGDGAKLEAAGVVHAGEYVINAEATRKLGRGLLDRLNGYANGGLVGALTNEAGPEKSVSRKTTIIASSHQPKFFKVASCLL